MLKKDQVGKATMEKGQKRRAYPCKAATLEMAPKKAKAEPKEVRKAPLKQDKAAGAPLTANGGQKVKRSGSRQGRCVHGWQGQEVPSSHQGCRIEGVSLRRKWALSARPG